MNKTWRCLFSFFFILVLLFPIEVVNAQSTTPSGPVYIVQEGDSLWDIAFRFHVSQYALARANGIVNANQINIGQPLVIPGLEGVQGILTTRIVPLGETLQSLSLRNHISPELLRRLNHITSPDEVYVGYSLVVLQYDDPPPLGKRAALSVGQSLMELAIINDTNPWTILAENQLRSFSTILPGEVVRIRGEDDGGPGAMLPTINSVSISSLTQGLTAEIQVDSSESLSISGTLIENKINFFPEMDNHYIALQGMHAMAEPGVYPLTLQINTPDSLIIRFSQTVILHAGDFMQDRSLDVDPETLDPETNRVENELWFTSSSVVSPDKVWTGKFSFPVDPAYAQCYTSWFGNRRSYNYSDYVYFHTGLDFCGQVGYPIYAVAPGKVVFAGSLTVRGKATMIDHGWGVYTAYMHQSEILVKAGDRVEPGELIGKVGDTGRVEGPHLHFEVLVGGIQVDPLEWLNQVFP
jgi:murein DD-endopeptidase MepM/ murein hydrolase activator NlpD